MDSINAGLDMEMVSQHIAQNGPALVKSGQATAVRDYIDHLATGGYA